MKQYSFKTVFAAISISIAVLFSSCIDSDMNYHPTLPEDKDFSPSERLGALMPAFAYAMHSPQENNNQHFEQMVAGQYGGYFATTNPWENTNFGTFNPTSNWVDLPFSNIMVGFNSNFNKVIRVTERRGYIYAWVNIMRVASMLRMTDTYGPIPYSAIGSGEEFLPFDNVQDVYHNMIADLDNSIAVISSYLLDSSDESPLAKYDEVYNGDFSKWLKFANSLKLRMAVRIAAVDTEYAKKVMAEAIADGPIETNGDNAFIPTTDNPYYKAAVTWGDLAVSAVLTAYMNGYEDPRLPAYMLEATSTNVNYGGYRGVRMGIKNVLKSRYGSPVYFSKPAFTVNSPLLVYCAAETAFLKAEAALRGWIAGGDAQAKAYYEEGIKLSMEQHQVAIGSYLTSTTSPAQYTNAFVSTHKISVANPITVSWDDAGTSQNTKLEKIITQKWLANFPQGMEAWCDYRRTGFPQFFPPADNLSSAGFIGTVSNERMVRRLPFPNRQYTGNSENVLKAVQMLGGDDVATTDLWWAKKQ
ncbi:SusD/RagB family nutrient-binding outer membrane lipoprotein [Dysgonomonas sp. 511]|uniref:SusD/RagB family nutrient-binding outer membrane lipoprotein n=1 Tax=Dysgonomonas sp. 511 TaxID=2302930 RepID=UPI0013D3E75D|nr:SusD/RagB family nutrient-binding outer membrane lipoprotein [Dysgonomonas sp. 511]NDV77966.1 SusD/RagB family nutrient-binding outer membrane lipoprotein [Dysgonomonas sp. 511]